MTGWATGTAGSIPPKGSLCFCEERKLPLYTAHDKGERMRFTFNLTEQDWLDFNMFTVKNYEFYKRQKGVFRIVFTILPFAVGAVFWLLEGLKRPDFIVGLLAAMIPLSLLFWFTFPRLYDALTLWNAKKILFKEGKSNILGSRTLFFEEDGIRTVTEYEESSLQYGAITKLQQSDKAVYLYTAPAMAVVLPLRVFEEEGNRQKWVDFIRARLNENEEDG